MFERAVLSREKCVLQNKVLLRGDRCAGLLLVPSPGSLVVLLGRLVVTEGIYYALLISKTSINKQYKSNSKAFYD
jgi:hypothetical protein